MQTMENVSETISVSISWFPHLLNVSWRGMGTKSVQDLGEVGGGEKIVQSPKPRPIPLKFFRTCCCKAV